jgi:glycosyltransferase involved in cell wall biosynthesis
MNILVLAELHPNKLGSMEEFDIYLAKELTRRGHRCYFAFTGEPDAAVRILLEEAGGMVADELSSSCSNYNNRIIALCKRILRLRRFVVNNRIELVHIIFYCLTNPYLLGAYCSSAKIVFTEQTSGGVPLRNPIKQRISALVHRYLTGRISNYVAITDFVRNRMEITHHVFPPQSSTIYNAINFDRFVPGDQLEARVRLGFSIDTKRKLVLTVANLIPEKGIQFLIESLAILIREYKMADLCLVLVGEGYYRNDLEQLIAQLQLGEHVHFLGLRSDVADIISAVDVVSVPSVWHEAFGFIVAEAMAGGRPVIASRIGGIPELIDDSKTGLLVEPADSRKLAEGIASILSDSEYARRLAENARLKCCRQFNLAEKVIEYADLYERVVR